MGPFDLMILKAVRCIKCGAGYGLCGCAEKIKQAEIEKEFQELMKMSDADLLAECERLGVK